MRTEFFSKWKAACKWIAREIGFSGSARNPTRGRSKEVPGPFWGSPRNSKGSSLVTTLLVITVLTVIVVAFMQSMSIERMTSRSYANLERAGLASDAAVNAASAELQFLFETYPDSATAWQPLFANSNPVTEATVYHFRGAPVAATPSRQNPPTPTSPAEFGQNLRLYAAPLVSGAQWVLSSNLDSTFSGPISSTNGIDLNLDGWVGVAPQQTKKKLWAEWVEILLDPSEPRNLDINPATGKPRNPPVARYAYWVEDESFKINLQNATNVPTGSRVLTSPAGISANSVLGAADGPENVDGLLGEILSKRESGIFTSPFQLSQIGTDQDSKDNLEANLPFLATLHSSAYNTSRGGWKRVDINTLLANPANPRNALDQLITTITNSNASPHYGQRFHRLGNPSQSTYRDTMNAVNTASATNAFIYLQKIAANIKDYIDEDSQPTLIDRDTYAIRGPGKPVEGLEPLGGGTAGPNPVVAFGKENVPMLQEYAIHARLTGMNPRGWSNSRGTATFSFTYDHYFEFWNMGTKDIYITNAPEGAVELGETAFLKLYNQPGFDNPNAWQHPSPVIPEGRPIEVPLNSIPNLVFPAGRVVVLTTAPLAERNNALIQPGALVYTLPIQNSDRVFSGTTRDSSGDKVKDASNGNLFNNTYRVLLNGRSVPTARNDYESIVFLGNNAGLLESHPALPIVRPSGYALAVNYETVDRVNSDSYFVRGGSLRGNDGLTAGPQPDLGDPRSLNEQLFLQIYESEGAVSQTRFYSSMLNNDDVPADSSIGALNANYVTPGNWPDYSLNSTNAATANLFVRDGPMLTIGELGNIFDPARVQGASPSFERARGGGRTLKVGQTDVFDPSTNRGGLWDGSQTNASRTWTGWRLADLFDISDTWELPGAYNPNGILRDGGLALKSLIEGFQFGQNPETPGNLSAHSLTGAQTTNLVTAFSTRMRGASGVSANDDQIFWERGEISEIPLFSSGTQLSGQNMQQTIDRGREEVIRRIIQAVTTKGNTYSIFAVGQALEVRNGEAVPVATSKQRVIVRMEAEDPSPNQTFNPATPAEVGSRFAPATNFSVRELKRLP